MATVGHAAQTAQNLINALMHVDREKESVITNARVIECLAKAKSDRKIVIRYIQLVENDPSGEYIGILLSTNEQVLAAVALYDRMCKPIELDSDDDHPHSPRPLQSSRQQEDDTASIISRFSAFDVRDNELDKLQERQRGIVLRVNRARASGVHPDLVDLAFGSSSYVFSSPPCITPILAYQR